MTKVNYDWVSQQLTDAKVRIGTGKAIMKMLKTWEEIDVPAQQGEEIFEILSKLALGYSIKKTPAGEIWVQAQAGQIKVGDVVRIRNNAFSDDRSSLYNGRVGRIVAVRSGDIIFKSSDDEKRPIDGMHFSPAELEKRVQ